MKRSVQIGFETGPAPPKVQIMLLGSVAIAWAIASIWMALVSFDLEKNGARAVGIVTALEGNDKDVYPVFNFDDRQGRRQSVRASFSFGEYIVGDRLNVLYPPDAPLKARIDTRLSLYFLPMLLGSLSVVFFAAAGLFFRYRGFFENDFAARRGKILTTTISPDGSATHSIRSSESLLKGICLVFGLASVVFFGAALWAGWQSLELARHGVTSPATVTKLVRTGGSHRLWFEFTDSDVSYTVQAKQSSNDYLVGDEVQIRYFQTDPHTARIDRPTLYISLPAYFAGLGLLFLMITVVVRHQRHLVRDAGRAALSSGQRQLRHAGHRED